MSVYGELLDHLTSAYEGASYGFQPADAKARIAEAIAGFRAPLDQMNALVGRQRAGLFPTRDEFVRKAEDALRIIEAQATVLESALGRARHERHGVVARTIVDQPLMARRAGQQKTADDELLVRIRELIAQVRKDVADSTRSSPDKGGGDTDKLGPLDVHRLDTFLEKRSDPKEDAILRSQRTIIGGQREPSPKSRS